METSVGRIGGQTLGDYVRSHPTQDAEFAKNVHDCSLAMVDYVRDCLVGSKDTDPVTALHLMDQLSDGLLAASKPNSDVGRSNSDAAKQWLADFKASGQGTLNGQAVTLKPAEDVSSEGLALPDGVDATGFTVPPDVTVLQSTIHYQAESARAYALPSSYPNGLFTAACNASEAAPGVEAALASLGWAKPAAAPQQNPSLADVFGKLQTLRGQLNHIQVCPELPVTLIGSRQYSEALLVRTSTGQTVTDPLQTADGSPYGTIERALGTLPGWPAGVDIDR